MSNEQTPIRIMGTSTLSKRQIECAQIPLYSYNLVNQLPISGIDMLYKVLCKNATIGQKELDLAILTAAKSTMRNQVLSSPSYSANLKSDFIEKEKGNGVLYAKRNRIAKKVENWLLKAVKNGCTTEQAKNVSNCILELQMDQSTTGEISNFNNLINSIIEGVKGNRILIRALNCLPHIHSLELGDRITSDLVFSTKTSDGKVISVNKLEELQMIYNIVNVLNRNGIKSDLEIILMDIDPFLREYSEFNNDVDAYRNNLKVHTEVFSQSINLVKLSDLLGVGKASEIWEAPNTIEFMGQVLDRIGESRFRHILNTVREGILKKNIADKFKSEKHILETVMRLIFLEFYLGSLLTTGDGQRIKPCSFFIERSKASNAATLFLTGAESVKTKPSVLFYWNEQVNSRGDK